MKKVISLLLTGVLSVGGGAGIHNLSNSPDGAKTMGSCTNEFEVHGFAAENPVKGLSASIMKAETEKLTCDIYGCNIMSEHDHNASKAEAGSKKGSTGTACGVSGCMKAGEHAHNGASQHSGRHGERHH